MVEVNESGPERELQRDHPGESRPLDQLLGGRQEPDDPHGGGAGDEVDRAQGQGARSPPAKPNIPVRKCPASVIVSARKKTQPISASTKVSAICNGLGIPE